MIHQNFKHLFLSNCLRDVIKQFKDRLALGLSSCKVYDQYHIKRCNRCQQFGYYYKDCTAIECCAKCGSDHPTNTCESAEKKYINCIRYTRPLHCSLWNVFSLINKLPEVIKHVLDNDSDLFFITETSEKNKVTADFKEQGYILKHNIRNSSKKERGGGTGIAVKNTIRSTQIPTKYYNSFKLTIVKIPCIGDKLLLLICVYRLQETPFSLFIDELGDLFVKYVILYESYIIAGDFNIHVDETCNPSCTKFHELLDLFDLTQHVHETTHMGHTLDLVISCVDDPLVKSVVVTQHNPSHHFFVNFEISIKHQSVNIKTINFRNIKKIDSQQLRCDITANYATIPENLNFTDMVTNYNKVMLSIIDKHAPVRSKTVKVVPRAPWFDTEYATLRRHRRKAEKKYRRTGHEVDKQLFQDLRKQTTSLAMHKKQSDISRKLMAGNRPLYSVVDELLDNGKEVVLCTTVSDVELANKFRQYFGDKVNKIRTSITPSSSTKVR